MHFALLERLQAVDAAQQRAFAAAGWTDDDRHLAAAYRQRYAVQDAQRVVELHEMANLDHGRRPPPLQVQLSGSMFVFRLRLFRLRDKAFAVTFLKLAVVFDEFPRIVPDRLGNTVSSVAYGLDGWIVL